MYYVYMLRNDFTGSFYVGQTNNLQDRVKRHNENRASYTKGKGHWSLYYFEQYKSRTDAVKREREIKSKKSKYYIEKLLKGAVV
ncbi:GIY-YIG nuclease family protein [candidate division WOR-3 bacterium]|nr:GIY-YIG nuclease family protein [candidate division WOR-3 bacterium]